MSKNDEPSSFTIICFSTDNELYRPMALIRQYLVSEECSNVKYIKEEGVEYDHNLNKDNNFGHFKFFELINLDKSNPKCNLADSYLILINLEKEEIFEQADLIINYIQNNGNTDKKIYIVGLYINASNIKDEYKEDNIKEYLDQQKFNYEYSEINFDSSNELIRIIDFISNDTIKIKKENYQRSNINTEKEKAQSGSGCIIF